MQMTETAPIFSTVAFPPAAPSHTSRSRTVDPAEVAHLQVHHAVFGPTLPRQTDAGAKVTTRRGLCLMLVSNRDFQILTRAVVAVRHL
jgi:hypothetical protein